MTHRLSRGGNAKPQHAPLGGVYAAAMGKVITDKSGKPVQATTAWIVAVCTVGYMLPWALAATRGKSNSGAIFWLNLLLGWSVIGWIIALVMALGSHQAVGVRD